MKRSFRRIAAAGLSLLLTLSLTACGTTGENDTKILKLALEIAPNALTTEMAQKAADRIKDETNGSVVVEIYPSGQLGSQRDFVESIHDAVLHRHHQRRVLRFPAPLESNAGRRVHSSESNRSYRYGRFPHSNRRPLASYWTRHFPDQSQNRLLHRSA